MKSAINGVRYNTDSSIKIGDFARGLAGDPGSWNATLYQRPKAKTLDFFLYGMGDGMSRFGGSELQEVKERIYPLTYEDAQYLAQNYIKDEDLQAWIDNNLTKSEARKFLNL